MTARRRRRCRPTICRASCRRPGGNRCRIRHCLAALCRGGRTASPATESMTVTTDKADYAPGSTATFTVAGVNSGSSVAFQIADLASDPGINGIADVYAPFSVTDGGTGDADGLANGAVVAQWQVPADGSATGAVLQLTAASDSQTAITTFSDAPNKIVSENLNAGTPKSVWAIHGSIANQGDSQIEGFATQISTNAGQTVSFKIDTASSGYTLDIYRLGYYGGNGARLVTTMHHSGADNQPNPIFNDATNTVDAGNWSVTDSWAIPSTAVSGVYFAKLTTDTGNFQNMIPFIVRNDGTTSDILFQTSDTTWEAYNPWGGYNLYQGPSGTNSDRAYAVSYNRPIAMNSTAQRGRATGFPVWRGIRRDLLAGAERLQCQLHLWHRCRNQSRAAAQYQGLHRCRPRRILVAIAICQCKGCGRRGCQSRLPERQSNLLGYRACTEFRRQPYAQPNDRGIQGHLERDATRSERDEQWRSGVCFATLSMDPERQKIRSPERSSRWTISARSTTSPSPPACRNCASGQTPALPAATAER